MVKLSVATDNLSDLPKILEGIQGKEKGGQLVNIESDVKTVKGDVKQLKETVTNLSQQLSKAMDTVNNQLERLNSSRDDQEYEMANQVISSPIMHDYIMVKIIY